MRKRLRYGIGLAYPAVQELDRSDLTPEQYRADFKARKQASIARALARSAQRRAPADS